MPPTLANGKICYVEIPATDLDRSVAFYRTVFGWSVRQRGDGSLAFDDGLEKLAVHGFQVDRLHHNRAFSYTLWSTVLRRRLRRWSRMEETLSNRLVLTRLR
jgi:predicted enzyme related to lactoylglutathione lyase